MKRNPPGPGRFPAIMTLVLLLLGCTGAHQARDVIPEPPPSPGRKGAGPWLLQWVQSNLWVRNPAGDIGYALTRSGRVVAGTLGGYELGWTGVAISPDGRRVAYVETATGSPGLYDVRGWSLLWVVNADGSDRRLLVDLRRHFRPEDLIHADSILWSSDGSRVAYTVHSSVRRLPIGQYRSHTLVNAVELANGRQETLFHWSEGWSLQPQGWSIERGEFFFTFKPEAPPPEFGPWSVGDFATWRRGVTARTPPAKAALSPDGQHLLRLPAPLIWNEPMDPPQWDDQVVEAPRDFTAALVQRVAWMHAQPVAYLSHYRGYGSDCIDSMKPPPALYRLEVMGNTPQLELREGYPWLVVLDFSPDDAWVLLAVVSSHPQSMGGCTTHSYERLVVAERSHFESSPSTEALLANSIPLGEFPASAGALAGFIGWLR